MITDYDGDTKSPPPSSLEASFIPWLQYGVLSMFWKTLHEAPDELSSVIAMIN
jgi:hypothetical protein